MKRRPWTIREQRQLLDLHAAGVARRTIAETLGRSYEAICFRLRLLGKKARRRRWTAAQDTRLREMRAAGHTIAEIARALRRSVPAVQQRAGLLGVRQSSPKR